MSQRVTPIPSIYRNDPDDTEVRAIYRAQADRLAREQLAYERRSVKRSDATAQTGAAEGESAVAKPDAKTPSGDSL